MKAPKKKINISQAVADDLGIAIVTGRIARDAPFPTEIDLCEHYGASRTVLREAIKMLIAKGLLVVRPRLGARIRPERDWNLLDPEVLQWLLERAFSYRLLVEFTEIRLSVEPGAAALAATAADPADRQRIAEAIEGMFAAERGEADPLETDIALHVAILNASGNRFYIQLRDMIEAALRFSIRRTHDFKGLMTTALDHKRIADAVLAGDPEAAAEGMRALILEALHLIRRAEAEENAA
ncbi:MAG: FCD domain-containing protein [Caulobacteraceae bacterium]